jgi:hypothetical protein
VKRRLAAATEAKRKADAVGASWLGADARLAIAEARMDLGDPDLDTGDLEEALAIYQRLGDDSGVAFAYQKDVGSKAPWFTITDDLPQCEELSA